MLGRVAFLSALVRWLGVMLTASACACTFQSQGSYAGPHLDATPDQEVDSAAEDTANADVSPPCTPDAAGDVRCVDSGAMEDADPGPVPDCPDSVIDNWHGNACCAPSKRADGWTGPTLVKYRPYDQSLHVNEQAWFLGLSNREGTCQCACTTGCELASVRASSEGSCEKVTPIISASTDVCKLVPAGINYLHIPAPCVRKAQSRKPLFSWSAVLVPADNPSQDRCDANKVFLGPPVDDSHLYCIHRPLFEFSDSPVCPAAFPIRIVADNKVKPNSRVCSIEACDCKSDGNAEFCQVDLFDSSEDCANDTDAQKSDRDCFSLDGSTDKWIRTRPPSDTVSCSPSGTSRAVGNASAQSHTLLCCHRDPRDTSPLAPFSSVTTN